MMVARLPRTCTGCVRPELRWSVLPRCAPEPVDVLVTAVMAAWLAGW